MKIKICRQIDELGRLVVPVDLRRQYGIRPKDKVYFAVHDDGILICSEEYGYNDEGDSEK